jgi:hypothetical protein
MALLRIVFIAFVVLSVIYLSVSLYSRARRRDKLEAQWDEGGINTPRDRFIEQGLRDYDGSLRRKLILGVYIVPMSLVCLIIYLVNFA